MAMKIRLARGGSKKRPYYSIVATDSRMPRDGRFIEKLGTYNPLLPKDSEDRVKIDLERVQHWLDQGAQPSDRVSRFLEAAGTTEKKERANLKKGEPHAKAKERAEERAAKVAAPAEEPVAPAVEPVAEEAAAEETTAEETATEETPAEEAAAEETATEETATDETATEETAAEETTEKTASE